MQHFAGLHSFISQLYSNRPFPEVLDFGRSHVYGRVKLPAIELDENEVLAIIGSNHLH